MGEGVVGASSVGGRSLRSLLALLLAGAGSLALLWTADRLTPKARVPADGLWDRVAFHNFQRYRADSRSRGAHQHSRLVLRGLWAQTPVTVTLEVASQGGPRRVRFHAHARPLAERRLGTARELVPLEAVTDEQGSLSLSFTGVRSFGTTLRVSSVAIHQEVPGTVPLLRLLLYAVFGSACFALGRRHRPGLATALLSWLAATAALAAAIHVARLHVLAVFPWLAPGLGLAAAGRLLVRTGAALAPLSLRPAAWVVLASGFQLALIATPRFGSIDAPWHVRNLWLFRSGALTTSTAPGLEEVPYPPAFYAVLSPFATGRPVDDLMLVRVAMGLLQALSPVLLFVLMRAGGASVRASGAGAATMALMPEAVLVLAKGIACNVFAGFLSLLVVIAFLRKAPALILVGLLTLTALSHAGGALSLGIFLVLWWAVLLWRGDLRRVDLAKNLAYLVLAAGVAWLIYYREVSLVFLRPDSTPSYPAIFYVRWYRVGKILQDWVLKFGLFPLILAGLGLAWRQQSRALRQLLLPWLFTALLLAAIAVLTSFPLRFEYFLMPAVAIAAGLGAEHLAVGSRGSRLGLAWAATFLLQVVLGVFLLLERFEIISVIMESPRWPFPFRL